ncbi:Flp pilus assembly complex ATPase component TadA [Candidatus Saccharibacteria bacterium]|nr:Flp pilus assembly complex ATPase component TadA [Candidatus Saccharibacteria bacterium]MCB9834662.1 Flp pilus assembly complex ATPase component TadA [Candidatus Nomurabacteria bacterium]
MLSREVETQIVNYLVSQKILTNQSLEEQKQLANVKRRGLLQQLIDSQIISENDSVKLLASATKTPYVELIDKNIPQEALLKIPKQLAKEYMAAPFGIVDRNLNIAMLDPSNLHAIDFLAKRTGMHINAYMANRQSIDYVINKMSDNIDQEVTKAFGGDSGGQKEGDPIDQETLSQLEGTDIVQDAPITRALNGILESAIEQKASDIHIEPREHNLKIRFRIDGLLKEVMTLPKNVEPALISRIKIMSKLKIDEHRIPQDGQAQINVADRDVDLRIAIAPITYGEQVVIRILDKGSLSIELSKLGFRGMALERIYEGIRQPHGMVLSTGPTGSGKSTTLYAVLNQVKDETVNIVTLEDPVEYKMDGINQTQINTAVGLTFASGLRSILRQDPNIIMVGEIRDRETADLAVQSALTGHLVLSTLHTNSAAGVLPRFLDMEIEPFLIASTVNTVIGQRLVRKICEKCKVSYQADPAAVEIINKTLETILAKDSQDLERVAQWTGYQDLPLFSNTYQVYKGQGCNNCSNGYKGRLGICEVYSMTQTLEEMLLKRATTAEIQDQTISEGMITMQQDGYLKALVGMTTIEEVERVASEF